MRRLICAGEKWIMAVVAGMLFPVALMGQHLPESIVAIAEQMSQEEGSEASVEEFLDWWNSLLRKPLEINRAGRSDLERLGLLSNFQISSLLDYIGEYGEILSVEELALVDGFNASLAELILPFITFEGKSGNRPRYSGGDWRTRVKYKTGTPWANIYSRLSGDFGRFEYGLTAENDAGEKLTKYYLPDFLSGYGSFRKGSFRVVAGDYTAQFGQGLALWKSFSVSGLGTPSSQVRNGAGIKPYKGSDENNFFRGAAAEYAGVDRLKFSVLLSAAPQDARVVDDCYTSLSVDGYHRTEFERSKRDAMMEYLVGASAEYEMKNLRLSLTYAGYAYNKLNGKRVTEYNRRQLYDGFHSNLALSAVLSKGHLVAFAEAGWSSPARESPLGASAAIAGLVWTPSYSFELSVIARGYSPGYIATHAGAFSSLSSCSNQIGGNISFLWRQGSRFVLQGNCDGVRHPAARFNIPIPSTVAKGRVLATLKIGRGELTAGENYSYNSSDRSHRNSLRAGARYPLGRAVKGLGGLSFSAQTRADAVLLYTAAEGGFTRNTGFSLFQEFSCGLPQERLQVTARATYYDTDGYATRIYIFETGLPQSFSISAMQGRGISSYICLRIRVTQKMRVCLKGAYSHSFEKGGQWSFGAQTDWRF